MVIQIVQSAPPDWWIAWLPLLGSGIVASAAFFGVIVSNRTNREAITSADDRDYVKWKRERLAVLADEVLTVAHKCSSTAKGFIFWEPNQVQEEFIKINNELAAIPDVARRMELVAGDKLGKQCEVVRQSVADCMQVIAEDYNDSHTLYLAGNAEKAQEKMNKVADNVAVECLRFTDVVRKTMDEMTGTTHSGTNSRKHKRIRRSPKQAPNNQGQPNPELTTETNKPASAGSSEATN